MTAREDPQSQLESAGAPAHAGNGNDIPLDEYDVWLIDLDGTLYHALPVRLAMVTELLVCGGRTAAVIRRFRKTQESMRKRSATLLPSPYDCQLRETAEQLSLSVDVVRRIVVEWMFERPGKWIYAFRRRHLIRRTRQFRVQGGRTALVSDYPASQKLAAIGATKLFDAVVASGDSDGPARLKPWPDGLLAAAHRLDVAPHQCLMIGDRTDTDGQAAHGAQMDFWQVGTHWTHIRRATRS